MEKSQLRSVMREQRRKLDPLSKERAAENLCRQFTQHKIWHQIKHLGIYYPMVEELDTRRVIDAAWKAGKAVYLPTVDVEQNTAYVRRRSQDIDATIEIVSYHIHSNGGCQM